MMWRSKNKTSIEIYNLGHTIDGNRDGCALYNRLARRLATDVGVCISAGHIGANKECGDSKKVA